MKKNNAKVIVLGIVILFTFFEVAFIQYLEENYVVDFEVMMYTFFDGIKGVDFGIIRKACYFIIPKLLFVLTAYILFIYIIKPNSQRLLLAIKIKNKDIAINITKMLFLLLLLGSFTIMIKSFFTLRIDSYINRRNETTTIYEDYYIDPNTIKITSDERTKNLIYIYLESMECSFMSKKNGGYMNEELIPNLVSLANENINFSSNDSVGGFNSPAGTDSTISAIFSSETGLPFNYSSITNSMNKKTEFMPSVMSIGDILKENGYVQEFICGSDATFGAKNAFFATHGDYKIYDYFSALNENKVDEHVNWGMNDKDLYLIAKSELLKLSKLGKPFNFTMLTIDTHFGGYKCDLCPNIFDSDTKNIINCADNQIYDFIEWIKQQDFYDETMIVISGDHITMDASLVKDIECSKRYVYNCFINTGLKNEHTKNRKFSSIDMFPTILSALGFTIDGDKLALGTNLFSNKKTLTEILGYDFINNEFRKFSEFYAINFYN